MFITLEGIEGSGKSTQLPWIAAFLTERGHACVTTREPGGTALGARIRAILLDPTAGDLTPTAELLLYVADRAQHVETVIRPALVEGKIVICDRFFDATLAYQGAARGKDPGLIRELHRIAIGGLMPDLTLLFDLPVQAGLARAWHRVAETGDAAVRESRFEKETLAFHASVREGYQRLAAEAPDRFRRIDAGPAPDAVFREIREVLTAAEL